MALPVPKGSVVSNRRSGRFWQTRIRSDYPGLASASMRRQSFAQENGRTVAGARTSPTAQKRRPLTARQCEVLGLLTRGLSEKEIATELGMSQSRVTQHVRALKDRLGTETRSGLVAATTALDPCEKLTGGKNRVPPPGIFSKPVVGAIPERVSFSDAAALPRLAAWDVDGFDRVGPGALDGKGAALKRTGFVLLVAFGPPVLVLLTQAAMMALSATGP